MSTHSHIFAQLAQATFLFPTWVCSFLVIRCSFSLGNTSQKGTNSKRDTPFGSNPFFPASTGAPGTPVFAERREGAAGGLDLVNVHQLVLEDLWIAMGSWGPKGAWNRQKDPWKISWVLTPGAGGPFSVDKPLQNQRVYNRNQLRGLKTRAIGLTYWPTLTTCELFKVERLSGSKPSASCL